MPESRDTRQQRLSKPKASWSPLAKAVFTFGISDDSEKASNSSNGGPIRRPLLGAVRFGRTVWSMSFTRNAASYLPRPWLTPIPFGLQTNKSPMSYPSISVVVVFWVLWCAVSLPNASSRLRVTKSVATRDLRRRLSEGAHQNRLPSSRQYPLERWWVLGAGDWLVRHTGDRR